ncbi:MAG: ABC transporter permease, partial [Actinomycetia bacterium]|nr:ABC transporter permease [Actinomycetes bacterium]
MSRIVRALQSPVLVREMRQRMLSRRGAFAITVWLLLLTAIFALAYQGHSQDDFGFNALSAARIGREIFEWVLTGMIFIVMFLVPATTSGAIAGERERQTLVPLQVTLMSPLNIVLSKIAAAVVFTLLLIVLSAPLLALTYLIGGVTVGDLLKGIAMVELTAVMLGAVGVACSAVVKRVQAATVLAYGAVLFMFVGTFLLFGAVAVIDSARGFDEPNPPKEILALNPLVATADVFDRVGDGFGSDTSTPLG